MPMNTHILTAGLVCLLVTLVVSIPIFNHVKDAKQYVFPPNFTEEISTSNETENSHKTVVSLVNNHPIRNADTKKPLPMKLSDMSSNIAWGVTQYPDLGFPFPTLRIGGSASLHFRFWKALSKVALPLAEFLRKSLEHLVLKHCEDNMDGIPGDCFDFSFNLVNNWNVRDFIRSPSDDVMRITKQKKFDKSLLSDVIQVLRYHTMNLTDLLSIEKQHICGNESECDVICTPKTTVYCTLNEVIVPGMEQLAQGLEKATKLYFGVKIRQRLHQQMSPEKVKYYSKYRVYFVLGTMYNAMLQMNEAEAALTYVLDLSNIERLKVR